MRLLIALFLSLSGVCFGQSVVSTCPVIALRQSSLTADEILLNNGVDIYDKSSWLSLFPDGVEFDIETETFTFGGVDSGLVSRPSLSKHIELEAEEIEEFDFFNFSFSVLRVVVNDDIKIRGVINDLYDVNIVLSGVNDEYIQFSIEELSKRSSFIPPSRFMVVFESSLINNNGISVISPVSACAVNVCECTDGRAGNAVCPSSFCDDQNTCRSTSGQTCTWNQQAGSFNFVLFLVLICAIMYSKIRFKAS